MQEIKIQNQTKIQNLLCKNRGKTQFLCCSEKCQNSALICRRQNCKCLQQNHFQCQMIYSNALVKKIQSKRSKLTLQLQKAISKIDQIYISCIQQISIYRQALQIWKQNLGLNPLQVRFLSLIQSNQTQQITGNFVYQVKNHVSEKLEYQWLDQSWVQNFWKTSKINFDRLFNKVNKFHRCFANLSEKIDIPILSSKITSEAQKIIAFFNNEPMSFKFLYRASQNQFSIAKFHNICDGIPNTLTLIQTQFGKIIGGFTPATWQNLGNGHSKADQTGKSFIFSLTLNQKYDVIDPQKAIRNYTSYGPAFGVEYNKYDICILDKSNISPSLFNFPYGYNNGHYFNSQKSHLAFCGSETNNCAKIIEWEVFQVLFDQIEST